MAITRSFVQAQPFTVESPGSNVGDTSLTLSSFNQINGNPLVMADFGTKGYGTLEPGNQTQEEAFSFTGITVNSNGTVSLTGVSTQGFITPYTEISGLAVAHAGGVNMVVTNTAGFYSNFANTQNDETITEEWQFPDSESLRPRGITDTDTAVLPAYVTFGQLGRTAISGGVNASTIIQGLVQIATGAQLAAGTGTGSTGALVVPDGASFKNTSAGAGDANKVPVLNASGKLDSSFTTNASTTVDGTVQIATGAQAAAGTGTGSTGALLTLPSSLGKNFSGGAAQANGIPILAGAGNLDPSFLSQTFISGAAITLGQSLYLHAADGRVYPAISNASESTYNFVGIAQDATGSAGNSIRVTLPGMIALGLTSLTVGSYYYLTDVAGVIGTTPGTNFAKIGLALSTTTLLVTTPKFVAAGNFTCNNATSNPITITTGFYPARITFNAELGTGISIGDDTGKCIQFGNVAFNGSQSKIWSVNDNAGSTDSAVLASKTSTGFTITNTASGTSFTYVQWTAFSE